MLVIACLLIFQGCGPGVDPVDEPGPWFLKSGDFLVSPGEFNEELELKKSAYSYDIQNDADAYNEMVMDLVSILSDELRFFQLASDRGIHISPEEILQAETAFKKDYPEDSFEQLLLENAISYSLWKKRFKRNLLIDKVIQQELTATIEISADDIYKFYQKENVSGIDEKQLIDRLRTKKTQSQYDEWIQQLNEIYPVDINTSLLKTVLKELSYEKDN